MLPLTWAIPALPLAGFAVLGLAGRRLTPRAVAWVGAGSVAAAFALAAAVAAAFLAAPPAGGAFSQTLWTWWTVGGLAAHVSLRLDPLSLVFVLVVTFVGSLVLLYSTEYMEGDPDYSRFFAWMDLFAGSMLVLVLAADFLLLYLGWEAVGLCSYLLIGFWYRDCANGRAAMKAFVVTRVGDVALLVGILLLFTQLGTLGIQSAMSRAVDAWPTGAAVASVAAALVLGGAVGKSAQLPLQVWLPDAMAGPTPVSALIHAATMVTAGVYLIARTGALFAIAPGVRLAVAVIGALTLLIAGFSALAQSDIKKVAAYSTVSQLGYMFVALGVGAASAAVFHMFTHAFFKALIFLGAGAVIKAMDEDRDMFHMGGLKDRMPLTFWTFTIGCASLAALPLVTAGFYSKDLILFESFASPYGDVWLWLAGLVGSVLTALYASRMVLLTFFGPLKREPSGLPGPRMAVPMVTLAVLAVVAGFVQVPGYLGGKPLFTGLVGAGLPARSSPLVGAALASAIAGVLVLAGIASAYWLYEPGRPALDRLVATPWGAALHRAFLAGFGFDAAYEAVFVRPYRRLAELDRGDFVDPAYRAAGRLAAWCGGALDGLETGRVRNYAFGIGIGVVVVLAVVMLR